MRGSGRVRLAPYLLPPISFLLSPSSRLLPRNSYLLVMTVILRCAAVLTVGAFTHAEADEAVDLDVLTGLRTRLRHEL